MKAFDTFAMVDWSGGNDRGATPKKDAIWAATVVQGRAEDPVYLRNRAVAFDWLAALIERECAAKRRVLIGFDFPFGYPTGFARVVTGSDDPLALWAWFGENIEDEPMRNNRFEIAGKINRKFGSAGPFWFNGLRRDITGLPRKGKDRPQDHGLPERRAAERAAKGAFTCWQMGGAGAVGGQVMTGMATLARLRARFPGDIAVWPFEPLDAPVAFVEIWPSLIDEAVRAENDPIKDRAQVRLLAHALAALPPAKLAHLLDVSAPEEGWILGVGQEEILREALCPT